MITQPSVGSRRRVTSLAKVVFPDPVSPTTATRVPSGMRTVRSLSTSGPVG